MTIMRVLQLVDNLDVGGLERVVFDLCQRGSDFELECYLGCLSRLGRLGDRLSPQHLWLGDTKTANRLLHVPTLLSLRRYVETQQIDIIHSHNSKAHLYGALTSRWTKVPHIQTVHGRGLPFGQERERQRLLRRCLTHLTDRVVAVSDDVQNRLIEVDRLAPDKISTILNGIDTTKFFPAQAVSERGQLRRKLGLPADDFIVGSIGRLVELKNYPLLVTAFTRFQSRHPTAILVLVGDGPSRPEIEAVIAQSGIQARCLLAGVQHNIEEWLRVFDIFALSSDTEGTSITLLEAMATGLVCVATDVGGNSAVLDPPRAGRIVTPGDADALSQAIVNLASAPEERGRLGDYARRRVLSTFSFEKMITEYIELYQQLVTE